LTKSRTAVLAVGAGVVLLVVYGRTGGWRIGWKLPLAAALVAVVIGLGAVAVGGLDVQVLSEAPTSVLYRLQYWQSTAGIIADHPLLGCGPGQFQESYTVYKLPEASETPRDPHNFLLEVWSTAGTPALLALLVMAVALTFQLSRSTSTTAGPETNLPPPRGLYAAAIFGIMLAYPIGLIVGFPQELVKLEEWLPFAKGVSIPGIWLLGIPAALASLWLLSSWVQSGQLATSHLVVALIALAVNLLAAGAVSFPGVFLSAWVLACVALANAAAPSWTLRPPRAGALALLGAAGAVVALGMRTEFSPVLSLSNRLAEAEALIQTGRFDRAADQFRLAAADDPWSPAPHRLLAHAALQEWLVSRSPDDWQRFLNAASAFQRHAPRHHATYTERGHWFLRAWRTSDNAAHLTDAIEAYRTAALWYPGRALERVQLAWALHLAGRDAEALAAADVARQLDNRVPHRELKLDRQTIYDPPASPSTSAQGTLNAEQALQQLRNANRVD
jgi:tetratricopeptide (TPR) repeat protein